MTGPRIVTTWVEDDAWRIQHCVWKWPSLPPIVSLPTEESMRFSGGITLSHRFASAAASASSDAPPSSPSNRLVYYTTQLYHHPPPPLRPGNKKKRWEIAVASAAATWMLWTTIQLKFDYGIYFEVESLKHNNTSNIWLVVYIILKLKV